jgi:hypothetical protein
MMDATKGAVRAAVKKVVAKNGRKALEQIRLGTRYKRHELMRPKRSLPMAAGLAATIEGPSVGLWPAREGS